MQPQKPLSEYTAAGLLNIGSRTTDEATIRAVVAELRNRHKVTTARKEAGDHNRIEKQKLSIELKIEGMRSRGDSIRRKANADLYAVMKDRAFEIVDIPEGLTPIEAIRKYNRDVHVKATELYTDFKRSHKKEAIKERRAQAEREHQESRNRQIAERRSKRIESAAYQNARFPLIGVSVYYSDTVCGEKQVGTVRGFSYNQSACAFRIRIETLNGGCVKRAFSAIEPVENPKRFDEVRSVFMDFESRERIVRERDNLMLRVEAYSKRIAELDPLVSEYLQSEFRQNWVAADEVAKAFARDVRYASKTTLK